MLSMASSFRLQKWYLDLATEDGQAVICYWASLRWRLLSLHYHGYFYLDRTQKLHTFSRLGAVPPPDMDGDTLRWKSTNLQGEWIGTHSPLRERLMESAQGRIDWHCLFPSARARIDLRPYGSLQGLGYVEKLDMTLPPWKLPLQQMHWGRFLSQKETVVWIRWISPTVPKTLVFHNGEKWTDAAIEEDAIRFGDKSLRFQESCSLRGGPLGSTVFGKFPWIKRLFPASILSTVERKWRSRACLSDGQGGSTPGWAIHEVVTWP